MIGKAAKLLSPGLGNQRPPENADLLGTLPAALEADTVCKQGYKGTKRYIRAVITKTSGTSIAAGAVFALGHPHDAPVA